MSESQQEHGRIIGDAGADAEAEQMKGQMYLFVGESPKEEPVTPLPMNEHIEQMITDDLVRQQEGMDQGPLDQIMDAQQQKQEEWMTKETPKDDEPNPNAAWLDVEETDFEFSETQLEIYEVCTQIQWMLIEKNRKYGDSAINPTRVFSKANPEEQLKVRIDDKISRMQQQETDDDEDVVNDLIGYLILLKVARKLNQIDTSTYGSPEKVEEDLW